MENPIPMAPMTIARDRDRPIHRQIAEHLRHAVTSGQLRAGQRLPSSRTLAGQLGVARGTVDTAYAALAGEGFVVGRGAAGTIVAPGLARPTRLASPIDVGARPAPEVLDGPVPAMETALAMRICLPAFDAFPRKLWSRLIARRARALTASGLVYPDPAGLPALRQAIAAYLAVSRGIACRPAQVFVTGGYQAALGLIAAAVLRPGDAAWVEDPGYPLAREAVALAGAEIVPVGIDGEGMRVEEGVLLRSDARVALVTPSHQSPLGVALSLARRLALLDWAAAAGAFVVEDDYDSEFRYVGRPLPALKSLDRQGRVLYVGTFSKVLYPALRLGYLVVPEHEIARFDAACRAVHLGLPSLEQGVVADAMMDGHFARHLKRMRGLYAARRRAMAQALADAFGRRIAITLQAGGMHLLARFPGAKLSDVALAERARTHGLRPAPLSALALTHDCGQGLLIGFTNTPGAQAPQAAAALEAAIGPLLKAGGDTPREP